MVLQAVLLQVSRERASRGAFGAALTKVLTAVLATVLTGLSAGAARAQHPENNDSAASADRRPVVVELFLSQACKACPPAAALLRELAETDTDVFALSWHVSYWDRTPSRRNGYWSDPFAHEVSTVRQKGYNQRLGGRKMVFTPQAVVDGRFSEVGSKEKKLRRRINEARARARDAAPVLLRVEQASRARAADAGSNMASGDGGTGRVVRVDAGARPHDIFAIAYRPRAVTEVSGGANAGHVFRGVNIVRSVAVLAREHTGAGVFAAPETPAGLQCAIIAQEAAQGPISALSGC